MIIFRESYVVSSEGKKGVSLLVSVVKTLIFLEHFTHTHTHTHKHTCMCMCMCLRV